MQTLEEIKNEQGVDMDNIIFDKEKKKKINLPKFFSELKKLQFSSPYLLFRSLGEFYNEYQNLILANFCKNHFLTSWCQDGDKMAPGWCARRQYIIVDLMIGPPEGR